VRTGRLRGIGWEIDYDPGVTRFGPFVLDAGRRQLLRNGRAAHLTPKAFDLLVLLVTEAPRVVSKRELHERLWPGTFISDATLAGLIKELRRALDDHAPDVPIIRTAHRVGYAFCAPLDTVKPRSMPPWHWLVLRGRRVALSEGENVVGRDPASEVCLDDPSVSRRHARMVIDADGVRLEDLGSKNGTTVRGQAIHGVTTLAGDDRLVFGSVVAVYRTSASGMSTETRSRSEARGAGTGARSRVDAL
jgi:DNA-binding winged helix-turn-helix (wHTH) protein